MADRKPGKDEDKRAPSVVDATFGVFKGERLVSVEEERHEARRARAEYLARKHSAEEG